MYIMINTGFNMDMPIKCIQMNTLKRREILTNRKKRATNMSILILN